MGGTKRKFSLPQTLRHWLNKCYKQWEDMAQGECDLSGRCRRVLHRGLALELRLGGDKGKTLHIYPDLPVTDDANASAYGFLIVDPERFFFEPGGFVRLLPGQGIVLGRHDPHQTSCFRYTPFVSSRHITLICRGEHLLVKDLETDHGSWMRLISQPEQVGRMFLWRLQQLRTLVEIYGDELRPLAPALAVECLRNAHAVLRQTALQGDLAHNHPDFIHSCPAVIQLSAFTKVVVVGDLHGCVDNLLTLLTLGGCLKGLESKTTTLVILGDAVHLDEGDLADMTSSLVIMDLILTLMIRYPGQVVYLRGNHDDFSKEISKGGVSQGSVWSQALVNVRGEAYRDAMEAWYQDLPCVVTHPYFIACHAGPPLDPVDENQMKHLRHYPKLMHQIRWSRLAKVNHNTGYGAKHVQKFRKALGASKETPVIVGHNLLDQKNTLWLDAGRIKQFHVLYGAHPTRIGWIAFVDGEMMVLEYPVVPLTLLAQSLLR
ncbi:MAG: metallophosphoesterase [Magnetococcus sp. YQC-5]